MKMQKLRYYSAWSRLNPDQVELLEGWLFEQNMGYAEALARAKKEFGVKASIDSLGRYYQRRARKRRVTELLRLTGNRQGARTCQSVF